MRATVNAAWRISIDVGVSVEAEAEAEAEDFRHRADTTCL